jgi:PKHD-type hydroxylase
MKYGPHADAAWVNSAIGKLRSDVSVTVFLNDPATYEGGELVTHLGTRPVSFKLQPGEAIIYPSTLLHEVRPVTAGQRLVSITFVESFIPDEYLRTQLYELNEVAALEGLKMSWESRIRLEVVRQNLERLWSEG